MTSEREAVGEVRFVVTVPKLKTTAAESSERKCITSWPGGSEGVCLRFEGRSRVDMRRERVQAEAGRSNSIVSGLK